jgi:hypothetical protein
VQLRIGSADYEISTPPEVPGRYTLIWFRNVTSGRSGRVAVCIPHETELDEWRSHPWFDYVDCPLALHELVQALLDRGILTTDPVARWSFQYHRRHWEAIPLGAEYWHLGQWLRKTDPVWRGVGVISFVMRKRLGNRAR